MQSLQRRLQLSAPSSIKKRLMNCHLSKILRQKHKIRALPIKRGDEVKILKGKFREENLEKLFKFIKEEVLFMLIK